MRTMSKAERYIELVSDENGYLCDQHALRAVEIARAETIDEVVEWLKKNVTYTHPRKGTKECVVNISKLKEDLKQAMKDE